MPETLLQYVETCSAAIRSKFSVEKYSPGSFLLIQGDPPQHVFILTEGEASVYVLTPTGVQYLEYIYTDDELFGEVEILHEQPILCNVLARRNCRVIRVEKDVFLDWMKSDPAFALFISRQLAGKFYRACETSVTHITYPLRYRVLFFLWQATQQGGPYIRKEDLIAGLGSNERSVNRIVKDLREGGLIECDRGTLKIISKEAVIKEMSHYG